MADPVTRGSSHHARRLPPSTDEAAPRAESPATDAHSSGSSETYETRATSIALMPLQEKRQALNMNEYAPVEHYDPQSFDLVPQGQETRANTFTLEDRSQSLFSREHLQIIFENPSWLRRFTAFLSTVRPQSIPMLIYYLDALKALKAIKYANAVAEALDPLPGHDFTGVRTPTVENAALEEKAAKAFEELTNEDLPAYIVHVYVQIVTMSITKRITGTLAPHLRAASEGLAEVFCLTDPSKPDNPIVFASEEFHRTTQYGINYAIGRNCRFLQGPATSQHSVIRLARAVAAGKEQCEVFLNYRRDGSPFMNLLMTAPLCDSRGRIRYFIGAQVDVSGLVEEGTELESFQKLLARQHAEMEGRPTNDDAVEAKRKDEFQDLSEMFNAAELDTVRRWGGKMHREHHDEEEDVANHGASNRPRLLVKELSPVAGASRELLAPRSGRLAGVYQNVRTSIVGTYLTDNYRSICSFDLIRPYASCLPHPPCESQVSSNHPSWPELEVLLE